MAGATEVCRGASYRDTRESSVPITCMSARRPHTSTAHFLAPSSGPYSWRVSSYPPTGSSSTSFGVQLTEKTLEKPAQLQAPAVLSHALRFCPFGLRSHETVRTHINRMLFNICSSVSQCPYQVSLETKVHQLNFEIENLAKCHFDCKLMETVPPKDESPKQVGVSCQLLANEIHKLPTSSSEQADSDCDSDTDNDSDSEEGEEEEEEEEEEEAEEEVADGCECGYDSDSEDDDLVQFSDDSDSPSCALLCPPKCYVSLFSEESGYGGEESDLPLTYEELSGGEGFESWGEESDDESSKVDSDAEENVIWEQFQLQALSPSISNRRQQCAPLPSDGEHINSPTKISPPESDTTSSLGGSSLHSPLCPDPPHFPSTSTTSDSVFPSNDRSCCKRVSFKPDSELTEVHHIISWNFAYRAARKGPWEQYARDRMHFKRRIEAAAPVIESCLAKKLSACVLR